MEAARSLIIWLADERNWYQIEAAFGQKGGMYRLFATKDGVVCPIPRVLDTDERGTLYIGKANSFLERVIDMKKSILPDYKSSSHDAGVRYKKLNIMKTHFPEEDLMVELTLSANPMETERQALDAYQNKFGEVPPLNAI